MSTITLPAKGTWAIDPAHTAITFSARHLVAARVRGSFRAFSGQIDISERPETSKVNVSIDAASIDTGAEDRDNHLRSPDFLDVENFAALEFVSSEVRPVAGGYAVDGDLTIRDTVRPITLDMEYLGVVSDPWGNEKVMFSAKTQIDREAFGLVWNAPLEAGGWLVGKTVDIEIEVQAALF
jgi:polyisoprenoid-binding protein YceI